jgi:phospholipase D1/2
VTEKKHPAPRRPAWGKIAAAALALVALALAWKFTPLADYLTRDNALAWARAARENRWAPVAVILAYTPAAMLMLPRPFLTLLTIIAFGRWLGFAYGAAGILLAAMVTYYAGRLMRRRTVLRFAGEGFEDTAKVLREHGIAAVFASNQVPVPPFFLQGIIAGAIRIPAWQYAAGSFLGMLPGLTAAFFFAGELRAWLDDPATINWWIVGAAAAAFFAFGWWVRRWFARR